MIFNDIFGFLHISRKVEQLPNREKSRAQIQCMKKELGSRSKLKLKENLRRERGRSSFDRHR